jgi:hypothetical protein
MVNFFALNVTVQAPRGEKDIIANDANETNGANKRLAVKLAFLFASFAKRAARIRVIRD